MRLVAEHKSREVDGSFFALSLLFVTKKNDKLEPCVSLQFFSALRRLSLTVSSGEKATELRQSADG